MLIPFEENFLARRVIGYAAIFAVFLVLCLTYLARPIVEPDFFWHLKTGEWIWQHQALPAADPFNFNGPQQPDARQLVVLQGYWLAQLGYHAVVSAFGLWGVALMRVILLAAFFGLFFWQFIRYRASLPLGLALVGLFGIFFLGNYALERPQVFTFLAIGLLAVLYRHARERFAGETGVLPKVVAAFGLFAVWANLHGGVLVGQGVLLLILLVEGAEFAAGRDRRRFLRMLAFATAGLAGSLLSPARLTLASILSMVGIGNTGFIDNQSQVNYELFSIYKWLFDLHNHMLLLPVALSLVTLFSVREALRQRSYLEVLLLAIFWFFAYRHIRFLPIAMVFSLLFVAWHYRPGPVPRALAVLLLLGVALSFSTWTLREFSHLPRIRAVGMVDPLVMPVNAADFLRARQFEGRILNTINWGSYLLWRLAPDVQVAADGRVLNDAAYQEVGNLSWGGANQAGVPLWRAYVDRMRIDMAVVPLMNGPQPSELAVGLARDPEWQQLFRDQVSVVFARREPLPR